MKADIIALDYILPILKIFRPAPPRTTPRIYKGGRGVVVVNYICDRVYMVVEGLVIINWRW